MANDAVRRIMAEMKEISALNSQPSTFFHASPLESDLFEWHFSVRGPPDTPFEGGVYHGRILLPPEYPLKPPEIILLTPNGRFEVGKRICLSVTAHHQETWQPSWGIRTILTALVGFMPSKAEGVGALDFPDEDRRGLARKSHGFRCSRCGAVPVQQLPPEAVRQNGHVLGSATTKDEERAIQNGLSRATSASSSASTSTSAEQGASGSSAETLQSLNKEERERPAEAAALAQSTNQSSSAAREVDSSTQVAPTPTQRNEVKEKELLYIAYAIVALMIAVVLRRVLQLSSE